MILPDGYHDVPAGKVAAIVTHLEMRARPTLRLDLPDGWTLRRVAQPALDWYRDLHRRVGKEWLWMSRLRMSDPELAAIINAEGVEVHVLEANGFDEGLLELDFRAPGECEIVFFGVTAPLVGTRAGRVLLNQGVHSAWSRPITRVWLHTCTFDHPRALAFYRRSGFHPFRSQIEIMDDPRLNGEVPRHLAPHVPMME